MKKICLIIGLFLLCSVSSKALDCQPGKGCTVVITSSGSSCSLTGCLQTPVPVNAQAATVQIAGTFTGTLQFEESANGGVNWVSAAASGSGDTSATAAGIWSFSIRGITNFRVRASALSANTATATIQLSTAGAFPRLDQVLDPNVDKTFDMGANKLHFSYTGSSSNPPPFTIESTDSGNALLGVASNGSSTFLGGLVSIHSSDDMVNLGDTVDVQTDESNPASNEFQGVVSAINANFVNGDFGISSAFQAMSATSNQDTFTSNGVINYRSQLLRVTPLGTQNFAAHFYADKATTLGGGNPPTNLYGLFIDDQTIGSTNYAIKTGLGQVSLGDVLQIAPIAFAALPTCNAGAEGKITPINNADTATWGAAISGTGANHVLAYCDGTNWTVMGK